jgi:F0F1-type ATP synthase assembly protein I
MRMGLDGGRLAAALNLATVGLTMGACVAIGAGMGIWLDRRLDTGPWLAVIGAILGSIAAFNQLIRAVTSVDRGKNE